MSRISLLLSQRRLPTQRYKKLVLESAKDAKLLLSRNTVIYNNDPACAANLTIKLGMGNGISCEAVSLTLCMHRLSRRNPVVTFLVPLSSSHDIHSVIELESICPDLSDPGGPIFLQKLPYRPQRLPFS